MYFDFTVAANWSSSAVPIPNCAQGGRCRRGPRSSTLCVRPANWQAGDQVCSEIGGSKCGTDGLSLPFPLAIDGSPTTALVHRRYVRSRYSAI